MKHLKSYNENVEDKNYLLLADDMDKRLQGDDSWENFVNSEFDKYNVDSWFDYLHSGGDLKTAIEKGEEIIVKNSFSPEINNSEEICPECEFEIAKGSGVCTNMNCSTNEVEED